MDTRLRFELVQLLADQYQDFRDFAEDGMLFLGFGLTDMQADIAEFMQNGPRLRMVMAQRGEAKTTLAALYAIWRIIHRPSTRVLIVSAGEQNSSDTSTLIVRLIMQWDILECLRPDRQAGDRTSAAAFDVHYSLKGLDRSPSIACAGITSNLPGRRADLLIPDDIESNKNGLTVVQRQLLLHLSKEFSSICTHGDILYLGTPQSKDSIYNTLPGRGFAIRIWPGRYPTPDEMETYGDRLAPFVAERLRADPSLQRGGGIDGSRGQPADPQRYTDSDLIEKELDKGPEDFQLQYMLDTSLVDAQRQQLRLSDLVCANFSPELVPEIIVWQAAQKYQVDLPADFPVPLSRMYHPVPQECGFSKITDIAAYIDPAGGGTDEIGIACAGALGPYIHLLDVAGYTGGLTSDNENKIVEFLVDNRVSRIKVESNMGHGLFEINLRAILARDERTRRIAVVGEYSTGQKERRIITRMVSAMQRHRIVVHQKVFQSDIECGKQHPQDRRVQYSLWYQMANITTDRQSLPHDDRLEAASGAIAEFAHVLVQDERKAAEVRKALEYEEWMRNPMGYTDMPKPKVNSTRSRVSSKHVTRNRR